MLKISHSTFWLSMTEGGVYSSLDIWYWVQVFLASHNKNALVFLSSCKLIQELDGTWEIAYLGSSQIRNSLPQNPFFFSLDMYWWTLQRNGTYYSVIAWNLPVCGKDVAALPQCRMFFWGISDQVLSSTYHIAGGFMAVIVKLSSSILSSLTCNSTVAFQSPLMIGIQCMGIICIHVAWWFLLGWGHLK